MTTSMSRSANTGTAGMGTRRTRAVLAAAFALPILALPGCVFAVDGGAPAPKRLEATSEAAVSACGAGQVALVTAKGYACKGAPDSAIEALRETDD